MSHRVFYVQLIEALISVLASSFGLLATLNAGAFVALSLANFCYNAGLSAASLETLQCAIQRFAFLNMYFGHLYFPPSDMPG